MEAKQHASKKKKNNGSMMKSKGKLKKYIETNDTENITMQNLWDAAKAVLRGAFIVTQAFPKNNQQALT